MNEHRICTWILLVNELMIIAGKRLTGRTEIFIELNSYLSPFENYLKRNFTYINRNDSFLHFMNILCLEISVNIKRNDYDL